MLRSRSFDLTNRIIEKENTKVSVLRGSVGADLQDLAKDRAIVTDPEETRRRRTIRLTRQHQRASWGFTLQTYGIRNKRSREVEVMSYVDYVEMNGPAFRAGMKKGDVILSVNGESVDLCTHRDLVSKIQRGGRDLRLVVLFEDCCKKVELQERYIRLKKLMNLKLKELRRLEGEESRLLRGGAQQMSTYPESNGDNFCSTPTLLSRLSALRQSALSHSSTYSSASSDWDVYSEITSPISLEDVRVNKFAYDSSMSDVSYVSSAQGSNGSVSISSSSDSQSEHKVDLASDVRPASAAKEIPGKSVLTEFRLSSNGQGEDSEPDISLSTGQGDGDSDSQTSFSLSESSPRMSSLTEIMAREESARLSDVPSSTDDENFRQMYTVARWVGMNTGPVRRRSLCLANSAELGNDVSGLREVRRPRGLGSVSETVEEDANSGYESHCLNLVKENECEEENASAISTPSARGSGQQQLTPTHNFYIESDSEESSVLSAGRGRRDTVIDVRDYEANNGHDSSYSNAVTSSTTGGDKTSMPVKEQRTSELSSNTSEDGSSGNFHSNTETANYKPDLVVKPVSEVTDRDATSRAPHVSSGSQSIRGRPEHINKDADRERVNGFLLLEPELGRPRFVSGVLVNDDTYSTKL